MIDNRDSAKRITRVLGQDIFNSPRSTVHKKAYYPGIHGKNRRPKFQSNYALQRNAIRALSVFYGGLDAKTIYKYAKAAIYKGKQNPVEHFAQMFEQRIDSAIYWLWAPTMKLAKQLVSHKHILVDAGAGFKQVNRGTLKVGDKIKLADSAKCILAQYPSKEQKMPPYYQLESADTAIVLKLPILSEIQFAEPWFKLHYHQLALRFCKLRV